MFFLFLFFILRFPVNFYFHFVFLSILTFARLFYAVFVPCTCTYFSIGNQRLVSCGKTRAVSGQCLVILHDLRTKGGGGGVGWPSAGLAWW